MKNLIILLTISICTWSSVTFAESAQSNDVLRTIPGARIRNTVIADASLTTTQEQATRTITKKKTPKQKQKKSKKKHHSVHKNKKS